MDGRVLNLLERYEKDLEELLALLESLHAQGELRYFESGDYFALMSVTLMSVKEALGTEIYQHRGDNV